jgi:hypothetical protein
MRVTQRDPQALRIGEFVNKLFVALTILALSALASAHTFTVGAAYNQGYTATAEYAHAGTSGLFLVGVATVPFTWATEVSVGILLPVSAVEGADLGVVFRAHLPVFDGTDIAVGQPALSAGVVLQIQQDNRVLPTFEVGVRNDFASLASTWPSLYLRAGLAFLF